MNRLVIDLSMVIRYAKRNQRVTGIQRVELNLIKEMLQLQGPLRVLGLDSTERKKAPRLIDLSDLDRTKVFSVTEFLSLTRSVRSSRWPDALLLKNHLDQFKQQKIRRALSKASIYTQALLNPSLLQGMGLVAAPGCNARRSPPPLNENDTYLMLGTGWDEPDAMEAARRHHAIGGRVVIMVHDMIPTVRPELHMPHVCKQFAEWIKQTTEFADQYLCVSNHTSKDLAQHLATLGCRTPISVTPLAHEFLGRTRDGKQPEPSLRLQAIPSRFVLCVGSLEARKNGARLLQAWRKSSARYTGPAVRLVFAGKRGWMLEDFERELATVSDVDVLEDVSDDELAWLYGNAKFTIFPSLYEGWGLPVGESLWFGTPCLASSVSSVPEVGGELVHYFDPMNITEMAHLIENTLAASEGPSFHEWKRAIKGAKLRTWQDHAATVLAALC